MHQDEGLVTKRTPLHLAQSPRIYIITPPETWSLLQPDPVHLSLSLHPQNGSIGLGGSAPINNRLFSLISAVFLVYFSISSRSIAFSTMT